MRSRVNGCDAIVMDLRGFSVDRYGCQIELAYLSSAAPTKPVLLIVDGKTDLNLITTIVGAPAETVAANHSWLMLLASTQNDVRKFSVFRCLAHLIEANREPG
jgi:hypothetical protein